MTAVVVDGWALSGAAAYRGVGTYARHVVSGLASTPGMQVTVLADPAAALPPGVSRKPLHRRAPGRWLVAEHEARLPFEVRRHVRRAAGDALFEPAPVPPRRQPLPTVQTLHDVVPLVFDDPALAQERRRWKHWSARYRAAAAVIAVSRYTADEGMRILGLPASCLHVVHHGVDRAFSPVGDRAPGAPYLLVVGEYSERKGMAEAFAAVGILADAGYPHRLRVAGRIAPWVGSRLEAVRAASPRPDRVDLLGFVEDLPSLYRGADAFVGSSRCEGFGFPALEAMACGTPVVAFANSATAEVVARGGLLVDDGDVAALVAGLRAVLDDDRRRAEIVTAGLERAATFSWERSVGEHAEILRSVAR